jgi:TetR/AcrR family transcriptional repressor of nem operon
MRYSPEHREKTRDSLLQAASILVRRDGPERISVSELMKSVGLTHGGFYYTSSPRRT